MQQSDKLQRRRGARVLAAISGLLALLALAVTFATVASSTAHPGIQPGPKPMQMGQAAVFTPPPATPHVEFAAPVVKAPRPTT